MLPKHIVKAHRCAICAAWSGGNSAGVNQDALSGPLLHRDVAHVHGAIGRPAGLLLHRGLHAFFMSRLWCFTVSDRAGRRHSPLWRLPAGAFVRVSTISWVPRNNRELQIRAPEPDGREHPQMAGKRLPTTVFSGQVLVAFRPFRTRVATEGTLRRRQGPGQLQGCSWNLASLKPIRLA